MTGRDSDLSWLESALSDPHPPFLQDGGRPLLYQGFARPMTRIRQGIGREIRVVQLKHHPNPNTYLVQPTVLNDLLSTRLGRRKPGCY